LLVIIPTFIKIKLGLNKNFLLLCNGSDLLEREQYYFDTLNPKYNILKIAGSSKGVILSEETKAKISKSLKGVYVGDKAYWFGKTASEETKNF
jgi:group I intron endonuclease